MKLLNGSELADFIKERQAHQVRALRQSASIAPKLAIIVTTNNPAITVDIHLKKRYAADIVIDVEIHRIEQAAATGLIAQLNADNSVQGIIVQLPLADPAATDTIVNLVVPEKDVEALSTGTSYDPAAPMAIMWLLAGYNIDLAGKDVLLIGHDKLVSTPLQKLLQASNVAVRVADYSTPDLSTQSLAADVIITIAGNPASISADMIKPGAVVVDTGVVSENGTPVGDLADDVYERADLTLTPRRDGIGPLVVCALFENVIRAARRRAELLN